MSLSVQYYECSVCCKRLQFSLLVTRMIQLAVYRISTQYYSNSTQENTLSDISVILLQSSQWTVWFIDFVGKLPETENVLKITFSVAYDTLHTLCW